MGLVIDLAAVEIRGDINLGSLCRLCANFGVETLHLVNPRNPFEKAVEDFACRGKDWLDRLQRWQTLGELSAGSYDYVIGTTGKTSAQRPAVAINELGSIHHVFSPGNRILLVMGRESRGLYNEELTHCDYTVNIPLPGENPVLNISHAAAVILWEIRRLGTLETPACPLVSEPANGVQIASFLQDMESFLSSFDYWLKPERFNHMKVIEGLVRRKDLSSDELRFLHGILRVYRNNSRLAEES